MNTQFLLALTCFLIITILSVLIPDNKRVTAIPVNKKDTTKDRDDCEWC
jgi:hypothetical protein